MAALSDMRRQRQDRGRRIYICCLSAMPMLRRQANNQRFNRPEVNDGQQNYLIEVNGYLVTVYADQEDQYLAPAPPKPRPTAQEVKPATPVMIQDVKTGGFLGRLFKR